MFTASDVLPYADRLISLRHALHREPELGLDLPRSQAKVLEALAGLPLEITTGRDLTSVTAVLRGGRPGPAVLLRGDMDALPVPEESGVAYASTIPGVMHACGHDIHTSAVVGAAHLLASRRAELAGDVVFMFQPGEEGQRGAKVMIDEGVLDAAGSRVIAAYAIHVASTVLPLGVVATRPGTILAASDSVTVTVHGKGGHGSSPHLAVDPVPALCEMVTALQTMVTRTVDAFDPAVLTVGSIHAGSAFNVIPASGTFQATVRTFSPGTHRTIQAAVRRVVRGIADAHGVRVEIDYQANYPVTVNDPAEAAFALATVQRLVGPQRAVQAPQPVAGAEDFSFVLEQVPGAYLMIGAVPPGTDPATAPMNHAPQAIFDDRSVPEAALVLATLAAARLAAASPDPSSPDSSSPASSSWDSSAAPGSAAPGTPE
ncbi:hippurate hydrolase [Actinoplanes octamycinicus]|uniref:Hippurate hydrolase n=1 Tax=Actinoplanes octamycinicus TaxID=135948 RepID=A0A7W7GVI2_9ACTN|nr:M20 family metallopeptidase [Actinoplanes octamycinicus]MBB4739076.1 hippurate hydrolase [Actinoplanes octamycinicus]GIE60207.1 amidohydrolase [Actinoplanes octamycinicus]